MVKLEYALKALILRLKKHVAKVMKLKDIPSNRNCPFNSATKKFLIRFKYSNFKVSLKMTLFKT